LLGIDAEFSQFVQTSSAVGSVGGATAPLSGSDPLSHLLKHLPSPQSPGAPNGEGGVRRPAQLWQAQVFFSPLAASFSR
jgi:hypothetical protein